MKKRTIYLVGIGMGNISDISAKTRDIIENANVLIGAGRMLDIYEKNDKVKYDSYNSSDIAEYIKKHTEYENICVLLSGDTGFYSGATKLIQEIDNLEEDFETEIIPGISSLSYFCAKLRISWDKVAYVSIHGKKSNPIYTIAHNEWSFILLGKGEDIKIIADKLLYYEIKDIELYVGERLSYEDERINVYSPAEASDKNYEKLAVLMVHNKKPRNNNYYIIKDEEFIRDKVPMTKSEVRTISVGNLDINNGQVVYDIGAGTGSVSVMMALQNPLSQVYAIEHKPEAINLIEKNKKKFAADNLEIVEGNAAKVIETLPIPDCVFIGGSGGYMREILGALWKKNEAVKIVINTIAVETLNEVLNILKENNREYTQLITLNVSKASKVGNMQLMQANNPVNIIVL